MPTVCTPSNGNSKKRLVIWYQMPGKANFLCSSHLGNPSQRAKHVTDQETHLQGSQAKDGLTTVEHDFLGWSLVFDRG